MMTKFYQKYLLPGLIFQSVTIGGGYGTGRELVEFFLSQGPLAGYIGMLVATLIWGMILGISYELARIGKAYDYRSFIRLILGKWWWIYELVYVLGLILVVSVVGSASGELLEQMSAWPKWYGTIIMMALVGMIVFFGSKLVERSLSLWSAALYLVYVILIILVWNTKSEGIVQSVALESSASQPFLAGIKYAAYNVGILPAILFSARYIESRKEALTAGMLGGFIAMIPGACIYTAMLSSYPEILNEAIPANYLLTQLGFPLFQLLFQIVLFGTFVETGLGLIHGFNERISKWYEEKGKTFSAYWRVGLALGILIISIFLADAVGLVDLIAKGYNALTWGYWIVYLIPVMIIGVYRLLVKKDIRAKA